MSHGFEFLGSYTWSRNFDQTSGSSGSGLYETHLVTNDQTNFRQAWGPTDFDRTNRAVLSLVYKTSFASRMSPMMSRIIGDWQVSAVAVAQSGTPITIVDDSAGSVYGNYPFENRAQLAGGIKPGDIRLDVFARIEHLSQPSRIHFGSRSSEWNRPWRHRFRE